jgi:hypothetical protein
MIYTIEKSINPGLRPAYVEADKPYYLVHVGSVVVYTARSCVDAVNWVKERAQQLRKRLKNLKYAVTHEEWNDAYQPVYGICVSVCMSLDLQQLFLLYPDFSGNMYYPLKSLDPNMNEEKWYEASCPNRYAGVAGEQRLQLLDWLIEYTDKEPLWTVCTND